MKIDYHFLKNKKNQLVAIERCCLNRNKVSFLADRHWIVPLLIPKEKIKVLEIGGGSLFSYQYALDEEHKNLLDYYVYDSFDESTSKRLDKIKFIRYKPENKNIPLSNAKFDLIIAMDVIEHVIDTDEFLNEIKRLLKDDGKAIITTPNYSNLKFTLKYIMGHMAHDPLGSEIEKYTFREHVKYFTNRNFYPYIESRGLNCEAKIFHSLRVTDAILNNNIFIRLLINLYNLLPKFHNRFSHTIIGVFNKNNIFSDNIMKINI